MREFSDENCSNARIFINYKNPKNPERFEFPEKSSIFAIGFRNLFTFWVQLILIFLFINLIFFIIGGLFNINDLNEKQKINTNKIISYIVGGTLILFIDIPLILTLLFYKNRKFLKFLPQLMYKINVIIGGYYYVKIEKLNERKFVIPLFNNIFMDYKAIGDFKKYLTNFEIVEHDFYYQHHWLWKRGKKVKNASDWKAVFYFSKIPKKGYLEIKYI